MIAGQGDSTSCCSSGNSVGFYWHGCQQRGQHVAAAVDAADSVLYSSGNRLRHPFTATLIRGEVRALLEVAQEGQLNPVDEVKAIQSPSFSRLYEFRWNDLEVQERDETGQHRRIKCHLRLIESEDPSRRPFTAVGLHIFEKRVDGTSAQVRAWQNHEIQRAEQTFRSGCEAAWHIPELQ